jgi:hypothetical protein
MAPLFLVSFIGGLLLAVFAMLNGVERRSGFSLNRPAIAAFATVFGAVGYPLLRAGSLRIVPVLAIAAASGLAGAAIAIVLVAAWAIPSARAEVIDERFLLQGSVARVLSVTDGGATGMIAYEVDGVKCTAPARTVDGTRLEPGEDVVIERLEEGTATVEPWATVEARL